MLAGLHSARTTQLSINLEHHKRDSLQYVDMLCPRTQDIFPRSDAEDIYDN
jgi:hypothetical protein